MYTGILVWSMEALALFIIGAVAYGVLFARPAAANQQMSVRPVATNQRISIIIYLLLLILTLAAVGQIILLRYPAVPDRFRLFLAYTIFITALMAQCLAQISVKQRWSGQKALSSSFLVLLILFYAGLVVVTIFNL